MWTSALFGVKTSDFSKFVVCVPTDKWGGELSKCGHFADKGEGVNFRDFVLTTFLDARRPAPKALRFCCF